MKIIKCFLLFSYIAIAAIINTATAGLIYSDATNLLINGSFEEPSIPGTSWRHYAADDVIGWESSAIVDSSGAEIKDGRIEIWNGLFGTPATHGDQLAELNAHPGQASDEYFSISQTFSTVLNSHYIFGFDYRARGNNDGRFMVEVINIGSPNIFTQIYSNTDKDAWTMFSSGFIGDGGSYTLKLTSLSAATDTTGHLLDAVYVGYDERVGPAGVPVPEPGTLLLFAIAILGLAVKYKNI
ncbi:DUF642 domain-containing protein [Thalassotalea nanhaiensis]|uniref:DUF642 domain-containing protein n=1 Tax=Thalassotalea nanhaiensis TaxID=3065648 RepID=A0ABY9TI49_9GAMM|nr:DUF642 domain-containing protein [Colwelliaceae bacterium SQ345]